jgi:hypothetical protein
LKLKGEKIMASGGGGNSDWRSQIEAQRQLQADNQQFSLAMLDLQAKANRDKTQTEGMTALMRARAEGLQAIAKNLAA